MKHALFAITILSCLAVVSAHAAKFLVGDREFDTKTTLPGGRDLNYYIEQSRFYNRPCRFLLIIRRGGTNEYMDREQYDKQRDSFRDEYAEVYELRCTPRLGIPTLVGVLESNRRIGSEDFVVFPHSSSGEVAGGATGRAALALHAKLFELGARRAGV